MAETSEHLCLLSITLNEICDDSIGLLIEKSLKYLASEYYWPLLEELEPKLGRYEPLVIPAQELAEVLYKIVSEQVDKPDYYGPSCLATPRCN